MSVFIFYEQDRPVRDLSSKQNGRLRAQRTAVYHLPFHVFDFFSVLLEFCFGLDTSVFVLAYSNPRARRMGARKHPTCQNWGQRVTIWRETAGRVEN